LNYSANVAADESNEITNDMASESSVLHRKAEAERFLVAATL